MSQTDRVLERLRRGPLTGDEARKELQLTRLGARIFELRKAGHHIETLRFTVVNDFGEEARPARYVLIREATADA